MIAQADDRFEVVVAGVPSIAASVVPVVAAGIAAPAVIPAPLVASAVAFRTRSTLATLAAGMLALWIVQAIGR